MHLNSNGEYTSVILWNNGKLTNRSDAIIDILSELSSMLLLLKILKIIPTFIRDFFYNLVSKYRYKVFGKSTCRIPTPQERSKFLN